MLDNTILTQPKSGVLRTPDERFADLPGYPFRPRYMAVQGLRIHYVDEGLPTAPPVLLLHGEPSWSYLYRTMIPPLVEAGLRPIAPDFVGFGRSDKLPRVSDYSHQLHVDILTEFVKQLDLHDITLFVQDWGGMIGLRVVALLPGRFTRIAAGNTGLPDASGLSGWVGPLLFKYQVWRQGKVSLDELWQEPNLIRWVACSRSIEEFPVGAIVQSATASVLQQAVVAAYDAPFPDESYKTGPRAMPSLIASELRKNHTAWKTVLEQWEKPFLTTFSNRDPITRGGARPFRTRIPGAKGQPHQTIKDAGHFLQEDKGEELAQVLIDFINSSR